MLTRTTTATVDFAFPFELSYVEGVWPPGSYIVETEDEIMSGLSFLAYRRISTTMTFPIRVGISIGRQVIEIDPLDLEIALKRDAESGSQWRPDN